MRGTTNKLSSEASKVYLASKQMITLQFQILPAAAMLFVLRERSRTRSRSLPTILTSTFSGQATRSLTVSQGSCAVMEVSATVEPASNANGALHLPTQKDCSYLYSRTTEGANSNSRFQVALLYLFSAKNALEYDNQLFASLRESISTYMKELCKDIAQIWSTHPLNVKQYHVKSILILFFSIPIGR